MDKHGRDDEDGDPGSSKRAKTAGMSLTSPVASAPGTKTQTQLTFGGFVEILWKHPNDTMFYGTTRDTPPAAGGKIAGIDLDGALILTKSGARHGREASDWKWFDAKVPAKVRELHADGFRIVIFTNQAGFRKQAPDSTNVVAFKTKLRQIATQLKVPLTVLAATGYDWFRKPGIGMMEYLLENLNERRGMERTSSFFVGDAAGRVQGWRAGYPKDFSDSDRKFALNAEIAFYTPEAFFRGEAEATKFVLSGFDPRPLRNQATEPYTADFFAAPKPGPELVLFVGRPGAGKTTIAKKFFSKHSWINQDTLKTREKCVQQALEELRRYRSVVVDNTNPGKDTRKLYAELGIQRNIPVRVVWFTASEELCVHNNGVRASLDPARKSLPMTAWATYRGNFQEPTVAEGVEQVLRVDFRPDFGGDEKLKERWFMFQADPPKQW